MKDITHPPGPVVLLVDDELPLRNLLEKVLLRAGYRVICADDGREALRRFENAAVDVVITDLIMPNMEGIETIIELRRIDPSIPIIAMSGGGRMVAEVNLRASRALGAITTLTKPFEHDELLKSVRIAMNTARRRSGPPTPS